MCFEEVAIHFARFQIVIKQIYYNYYVPGKDYAIYFFFLQYYFL